MVVMTVMVMKMIDDSGGGLKMTMNVMMRMNVMMIIMMFMVTMVPMVVMVELRS